MKVYYGLDKFVPVTNPVVTSGTFDGVHLGHQLIIKRLLEIAASNNGESIVITLWPHPRVVLHPENHDLVLLSTIEERIELLKHYGVDNLVILPFTKQFSQLSSKEFIQDIIVDKLATKKLVIGYDHRFGRNREGSFEYLTTHKDEYSFEVEEIPKHEIDNLTISSTKIRTSIQEGNIGEATKLLGHAYTLSGKVVIGQQIGRVIGFPTANLQIIDTNKLIPRDGVYAIKVHTDLGTYGGMLNIGHRPTVNGISKTIEAHIFDFDTEIYGQYIKVELLEQIRPEFKFESLESLTKQLKLDKENVENILKKEA